MNRPARLCRIFGQLLQARSASLAAAAAAASMVAAACTEPPPSWQKLLAARIAEQYPDYRVQPTPDGGLLVDRPGLASVPVDVNAVAQFCQRGPRDCNYATDQMLLELRTR
jgi:hypothetical protein